MRDALYTILAASVCGGLFVLLLGKNSRFTRQIQWITAMVLLSLLISPLSSVAAALRGIGGFSPETGGGAVDGGGTLYAALAVEGAVERAEETLCRLIAAKTGIPWKAISVSLATETEADGEICVTEAQVTVRGLEYRIISDKIRAYTEDMLLCSCRVVCVPRDGGESE